MGGRHVLLARLGILCLSWSCLAAQASAAEELPRYKFRVGQQLSYVLENPTDERDDGKGTTIKTSSKQEWTLNVIDELADGGWRIVFVVKFSSHTVYGKKERTRRSAFDGYVDLRPDGQLTENETLNALANPAVLLPALPPDAASVRSTWSSVLSSDDTRREFRPAAEPFAADTFRFHETIRSALDAIYPSQATRDYEFDLKRGLISQVQIKTKYEWPASLVDKPYERTMKLVSSQLLPASDRAEVLAQMNQYLEVSRTFDRLSQEARRDFSQSSTLLGKAKQTLDDARPLFTLDAVRELLDAKQAHFEETRELTLRDAQDFGPLIGKPSPEWTTTDLDGKPHALADYRGKVVLLDFWYRGCTWCIRSMPQLKQLADDFQQDLVVLGINSDQNADDARFVIERLQLSYATLQNGMPPDSINFKYKVHGWPTLVLIDPEGVIRDIHLGYSPTLRDDLSAKIRQLLDKQGQ